MGDEKPLCNKRVLTHPQRNKEEQSLRSLTSSLKRRTLSYVGLNWGRSQNRLSSARRSEEPKPTAALLLNKHFNCKVVHRHLRVAHFVSVSVIGCEVDNPTSASDSMVSPVEVGPYSGSSVAAVTSRYSNESVDLRLGNNLSRTVVRVRNPYTTRVTGITIKGMLMLPEIKYD